MPKPTHAKSFSKGSQLIEKGRQYISENEPITGISHFQEGLNKFRDILFSLEGIKNQTSGDKLRICIIYQHIIALEFELAEMPKPEALNITDEKRHYNKLNKALNELTRLVKAIPIYKSTARNTQASLLYFDYGTREEAQKGLNDTALPALRVRLKNYADRISDMHLDCSESDLEEVSDEMRLNSLHASLKWRRIVLAMDKTNDVAQSLSLLLTLQKISEISGDASYMQQMADVLKHMNFDDSWDLTNQFEILSYHLFVLSRDEVTQFTLAGVVPKLEALYPKLKQEDQAMFTKDYQRMLRVKQEITVQPSDAMDVDMTCVADKANWEAAGDKVYHEILEQLLQEEEIMRPYHLGLLIKKLGSNYLSNATTDTLRVFQHVLNRLQPHTSAFDKPLLSALFQNACSVCLELFNADEASESVLADFKAIYEEMLRLTQAYNIDCNALSLMESQLQHLQNLRQRVLCDRDCAVVMRKYCFTKEQQQHNTLIVLFTPKDIAEIKQHRTLAESCQSHYAELLTNALEEIQQVKKTVAHNQYLYQAQLSLAAEKSDAEPGQKRQRDEATPETTAKKARKESAQAPSQGFFSKAARARSFVDSRIEKNNTLGK